MTLTSRRGSGQVRYFSSAGVEPGQRISQSTIRNPKSIINSRGYRTGPGQFGEQIILSGLAVERLEPGARLQLGNEACVEITKPRTGCDRLQAAQGKEIEGLGAIGVMAKVIAGGAIEVGDPVTVLETSPSAETARQ